MSKELDLPIFSCLANAPTHELNQMSLMEFRRGRPYEAIFLGEKKRSFVTFFDWKEWRKDYEPLANSYYEEFKMERKWTKEGLEQFLWAERAAFTPWLDGLNSMSVEYANIILKQLTLKPFEMLVKMVKMEHPFIEYANSAWSKINKTPEDELIQIAIANNPDKYFLELKIINPRDVNPRRIRTVRTIAPKGFMIYAWNWEAWGEASSGEKSDAIKRMAEMPAAFHLKIVKSGALDDYLVTGAAKAL